MTDADKVATYYDRMTESYLGTYGDTIQAYRPTDVNRLHAHILQSTGMQDGMRVLDAGCGVGGPAIYFAEHLNAEVEGITISNEQVAAAENFIEKATLKGKLKIVQGDFHRMTAHYADESFDLILFLESLGHSHDPASVIQDSFKLLKKGGCIYIKDFYPLEIKDAETRKKHQAVIDRINEHYSYNVLDLNSTILQLRQAGFEIDFIKRFNFEDDIVARSAFETENNIDLYAGQPEFIVAEWLEIKCRKPEFPLF